MGPESVSAKYSDDVLGTGCPGHSLMWCFDDLKIHLCMNKSSSIKLVNQSRWKLFQGGSIDDGYLHWDVLRRPLWLCENAREWQECGRGGQGMTTVMMRRLMMLDVRGTTSQGRIFSPNILIVLFFLTFSVVPFIQISDFRNLIN